MPKPQTELDKQIREEMRRTVDEVRQDYQRLWYLFKTHNHTGVDFTRRLENADISIRSLIGSTAELVVGTNDSIAAAVETLRTRGGGIIRLLDGTHRPQAIVTLPVLCPIQFIGVN